MLQNPTIPSGASGMLVGGAAYAVTSVSWVPTLRLPSPNRFGPFQILESDAFRWKKRSKQLGRSKAQRVLGPPTISL